MRLAPRIAALCLATSLGATGPALAAHPYTVDDLLSLEARGGTAIDPTGRWLIVETRARYDSAPRYDYDGKWDFALGRVLRVDIAASGPAEPAFPAKPGEAYRAGPFAPDGRRMVVYRHRDDLWDTGVVDLTSRAVRWLGISADISELGRTVQWRSSHELILAALAPGALPMSLRTGRDALQRPPELWRRTTYDLGPALTVVGSGRNLADRPAPAPTDLVLVDVDQGVSRSLARGAWVDLELSSDGRHLAAVSLAEPLQPTSTDTVRMMDAERRRDLVIIDLDGSTSVHPLPKRDIAWSLLSWSPAGDRLLVLDRALDAPWPSARPAIIDAFGAVERPGPTTLEPQISYAPYNGLATVRAGWRGDEVILQARVADAANRWFILQGGTARGLGNHKGLIANRLLPTPAGGWLEGAQGVAPLAAGAISFLLPGRVMASAPRLGEGYRPAVNPPRPDPNLVLLQEGKRLKVFGPGGLLTELPRLPAESRVLAARNTTLVTSTDRRGVETLSLLARDRDPRVLLRLNSQLTAVDSVEPSPIVHPGADGKPLISWLYRPVTAPAGAVRPLIVIGYPGLRQDVAPASGRPDQLALAISPQVLAGAGYAVLVVSLPAPTPGEPSQGFVETLLKAVDAASLRADVDPKRIALWGHSFGAYAALVTATRTQRFAAIIAANGPSDLVSLRGAFVPHYRASPADGLSSLPMAGWAETGQAVMAATPWSDPQRYMRNSPLFFADQIHTPILLIASDLDFVGLGQSEEMFSALWRQGKDVRLATFWGEGHVIGAPSNVRAVYRQAFDFLDPLIGAPRGEDQPEQDSRDLASHARTQASMATRSATSP